MRKTKVMTGILFLIVGATVICTQPSIFARADEPSSSPNHPSQIFLTNADLDPNENLQVIRAFVRTGTLNTNCLASMGDTTFVANGTIVFCAPRHPVGLGKGV